MIISRSRSSLRIACIDCIHPRSRSLDRGVRGDGGRALRGVSGDGGVPSLSLSLSVFYSSTGVRERLPPLLTLLTGAFSTCAFFFLLFNSEASSSTEDASLSLSSFLRRRRTGAVTAGLHATHNHSPFGIDFNVGFKHVVW